jgi:transcriptional regulator with XRE-family HTH domain
MAPMVIRATFAENLRRLRAEKGISQEELAHRAGIDRTYISYIENQRYAASIDVLDQLAKGLGVQPTDLLLTKSQRRKAQP